MKTHIKDIATIQTGLFAKPVSKGEIVYLQARHFDENGSLSSLLYPELKSDNQSIKHLLRPGNVLFAAKGTKNFAALYESKNQPAVASTTFFVIRVQEKFTSKILPEFMVWFLNHPAAQKFLKGKARGTSLASISKVALEELEISVPSIETQKKVLQISNLRKTEIKVKQQIEALRDQQIQQQLLNVLK